MPKRFATDSDEDNERPLSDEEDELGPVNGKWPFDGFGRSYDVPVPSGTSCTKISNILARAQATAGEYTLGGVADTLLALPGLVVDGVGQIPVPLTETCAKKLIDKSARSCFGHNFDTKMDENVRKSWQIEPDRVQLSNALWQSGIDKLTQTIAERLGYRSVPMQCTLYKMLVYGEGGHFLKHQDTEKEDGMVATLVIQLPSTHEGGDLVIYRGGEATYRHDFGKEDGTAAFLPHYAVHYADAEHSLEEVTKGYRLALVYSLCLPPLSVRHLKRDSDKFLTEELAEALSTMGPEEESFALLLLHEYTEKSIGDLGSGALKGIDRARFVALEETNAAVPADRKMQFFIARLKHEIKYYGENGYEMSWWEESSRNHTITWFSTSGRRFGAENSTMKMNFLNPGHETFYELWRPHGSSKEKGFMGNHGPSKKTMYSRYAIIAWPAAQGVKNALEFINAEAAVSEMKTQKPIDAGAVGDILNKLQTELEKKKPNAKKTKAKPISAEFFQALCEILVDVGDVALVTELFLKCFAKICTRLQDKDAVVPVLTTMFRSLNWNEIGRAVLESFGQLDNRTSLEIGLLVANGLDDGEAKTALMHYGMEKAVELSDGMASCSTKSAEVL